MPLAVQRAFWGVAAALILTLLGAAPAGAYGPCGTNFDGPTACPITTSPATVGGTLASSPEKDYYVFYARRHTQLSLAATDTEDPSCDLLSSVHCSIVQVALYDRKGNVLAMSGYSGPQNGVASLPAGLSRRLAGGIYYAVVSGVLFSSGPIPYSLSVNGSPNVQYPPPCIVPKLRHNTGLARAKRLLARHGCGVGKIRHQVDRRVRRGDVIGFRPRAGTVAPFGTRVGILVSGRRTRRAHHGRRSPHRR